MKISAKLKTWLVENAELPEDADDDAVAAATIKAMGDGTLEGVKYVELTKEPEAEQHDALTATLKQLADATLQLKGRMDAIETPEEKQTTASPVEKAVSKGTSDVNVKDAADNYSDTKTAALYSSKHPLAGQQITEGDSTTRHAFDMPSERDKALAGVYIKWILSCSGKPMPAALRFRGDAKNPTGETHDEQMILHALHKHRWSGVIAGEADKQSGGAEVARCMLDKSQVKQVIDDTVSGGQEITPIFFDEQVILPTLLHGELFPRVTVIPVARGSRIESGTIGEFTVNSGGGDGTDVTLTTTAAFITAFNTTIFTGDMGIELGLDFLSDTPVDLASVLTAQAGEKMMEWLDEQIALGDGTTEPEGVMVAAGTTNVAHSGAAATVQIYNEHLTGIGKEYTSKYPMSSTVFCGTQVSYRRARGIAVGGTDTRLVNGMNVGSYTLFDDHPYAINNQLTNAQVFCFVAPRYRMYRRLGLQMITSTEGTDLIRANKMLMVGRFRFGGQLEDGASATTSSDALA